MDGSKRSGHSNAYDICSPRYNIIRMLYGFWNNKRVILFDTLTQQLNTNEILAVLGIYIFFLLMSYAFTRARNWYLFFQPLLTQTRPLSL